MFLKGRPSSRSTKGSPLMYTVTSSRMLYQRAQGCRHRPLDEKRWFAPRSPQLATVATAAALSSLDVKLNGRLAIRFGCDWVGY